MNGSATGSAGWKTAAAVILIVLGCLVATVSVGVIWLNQIILNTDKYVETVQPLSEDPVVKDAVATRITDALFTRINATQLAQEVLPEQVDFLAAPIVGATQGFAEGEVRKGLDTPQFAKLWTEVNRRGHEAVKKLLLGQGDIVNAQNGQVTLDLGPIFDDAKARLAERGIDVFNKVNLENVDTSFPIFESEKLANVQNRVSQLNSLAIWLPIIAAVLLIPAIWLSRSRMVAILWIGLGLSIGMVVLLVGLSYGRNYYLDQVSTAGTVELPVATAYLSLILDSLKTAIRQVFYTGLLIAFIGFALSPYALPTRFRAWIWKLYRTGVEKGGKVDLGPAGSWIKRQKTALRAGGVVLALVALVAMDQPSVSSFLLMTAVVLLYLGALEFLARKAA